MNIPFATFKTLFILSVSGFGVRVDLLTFGGEKSARIPDSLTTLNKLMY